MVTARRRSSVCFRRYDQAKGVCCEFPSTVALDSLNLQHPPGTLFSPKSSDTYFQYSTSSHYSICAAVCYLQWVRRCYYFCGATVLARVMHISLYKSLLHRGEYWVVVSTTKIGIMTISSAETHNIPYELKKNPREKP